MHVKKAKADKEAKRKQVFITVDSAASQADWLERINKQIATLRPWWQTLQDEGGEKIIDEMIAALPRKGVLNLKDL